jgi:DNA-binding response OmpR family regulator
VAFSLDVTEETPCYVFHVPFVHASTHLAAGAIARILIIDDEPKLRQSLAEGLELEGWQTATAATLEDALHLCLNGAFDVIVLDWMLPDGEGVGWLPTLRARGIATPVLMLSARGSITDRLTGFEQGADDYLVKPFAFAEIVARCRALLRRRGRDAAGPLRCGDLELDAHARIARRGREEILLTPREVDLLEYLIRRPDQTVSREMLARHVWHEATYTSALGNAINIHVTRLRQKIEPEGGRRMILTQHGVGYFLATPNGAAPSRTAQPVENPARTSLLTI